MKEWTSVPFWTVARRVERTGNPGGRLLSVYRDWGVVPKDSRDDNFNRASEDLSTYKVVQVGDLVLNKMKTWQGSLGVSQHDGIVSPAYFVCELSPRVHGRFLHHLLRSQATIASFKANSKGIRPNQWDLPYEILHDIQLLLPELEEQRRIADFLDDHVARIDQIIAARQQQAHLAEGARVSLVDAELAIVTSPARTRLSRLASIQTGLTVDENRSRAAECAPYPYLRVANVQAGGLNLAEIKEVFVDPGLAARTTLRDGDVLMTEGGDLDKLGRGTVWHGEISPCLHQNHVFAVRPLPDLLLADYLALYTQSSAARSYFEQTGSKTTNLASTSASKVMALPIPAVDIAQQDAVVSRCRTALARVDSGVKKILQSASLLQEYKQSLITAAVTGEFDVTTASTRIPE